MTVLPDMATRSATFRPVTANDATREVDVTFATDAGVKGFLPGIGPAVERLEISARAIDWSMMSTGTAPVLDAHRQDRATAVIGRVTKAWIEGGVAVARLRFSEAPDVAPIWARIQDGTLRSVSVGYRATRHERIGEQDGFPVYRATSWTPHEISIVAIPADAGATIRAGGGTAATPTIPNHEAQQTMTTTTTPPDDAGALATRATDLNIAARQAEKLIGRDAADDLRTRADAEGWSPMQLREAAFDVAIAAAPKIQGAHAVESFDNPLFLRNAMAEALAIRAGASGAPSPQAREFMSLRVSDMAARLLTANGVNIRSMAPAQIITRAFHSTSDFPNLLQNSGARVLQDAFLPAASGIRQIMKMREVMDFRPQSSIRASGVDRLAEVAEGGEVTYGTAFEAAESYRVRTFARAVSLTRQALVNDDLGAFDVMRAIGRAAAVTEAEELLTLLTANTNTGPTMADGNVLYRTQRNNLAGSGAAIDVTTVSTGRAAMRGLQTDLNGVLVSTAPRYLLVGPAQETAAQQFVASITPATSATVNPFAGNLEVVVEPRLTGNAWYLFADPAAVPTFEMATLAATGGAPQIESFTEANTLGVTLRAVHDFGIGAVNVIGTWRNAGQ